MRFPPFRDRHRAVSMARFQLSVGSGFPSMPGCGFEKERTGRAQIRRALA
jgi:hypothetical protein